MNLESAPLRDLVSLDGKIALVTGGAGHLGRPMCEALAELGATVVVASRNVENCRKVAEDLGERHLAMALDISSADSIRGYEGEAGREYFSVFQAMLNAESGFSMNGRNRRPPRDPVNALLSFAYTLLCHDCRGACEAVGLDPAVGFLHRDRPESINS